MARILMLVSSARVIRLVDGRQHITGYFVEEAIKPYDRFVAAGAEVVAYDELVGPEILALVRASIHP